MDQDQLDPTSDATRRLAQATAVLASLGEAGARLQAMRLQARSLRLQEETSAELAARSAAEDVARTRAAAEERARAEELRGRAAAARDVYKHTFDDEFTHRADLLDLARMWRAATLFADTDHEAHAARHLVEERLREVYPRPMALYDTLRAAGTPPEEAMAEAAAMMVTEAPFKRPGEAGPNRAAVGKEYTAVTAAPGPVADRTRADSERAAAAANASTPDAPANIDEHVSGQEAARIHTTDADRAAALATEKTPATLVRESFPHPLALQPGAGASTPANSRRLTAQRHDTRRSR